MNAEAAIALAKAIDRLAASLEALKSPSGVMGGGGITVHHTGIAAGSWWSGPQHGCQVSMHCPYWQRPDAGDQQQGSGLR